MNSQPIEKRVMSNGEALDVHSIFYTIQGEGPFCGTPSVFIRLAGCNLQCPACDTDYTSGRQWLSVDAICTVTLGLLRHQTTKGQRLVVITGGEPFRQNFSKLLDILTAFDCYVQIETNGTLKPFPYPYSTRTHCRNGVYVVCSPKAGKVHPGIDEIACCYKYVLAHNSVHDDGLPLLALEHSAAPHVARPPIDWKRPIYLQPMDAKDKDVNWKNLCAAIASCMQHGYILQLQVHKLINVE